jgi:hypothetical protein
MSNGVRRTYIFIVFKIYHKPLTLLQIKKCNNNECTICLPVELPIEVFDELHFLPDPEPSIGKNYTTFFALS